MMGQIDSNDSNRIIKRLDTIRDIPTLPAVAVKVNSMLMDYDTSITQLSRTIEKDQAMVSKVLKLVNSSFYGFRSKIHNIPHAVMLLGFNTIRNAILSLGVVQAFSGRGQYEDFDVADFWRHSVAVAVTSGRLSEMTRVSTPDDSFTAGLLHDMGKVILSQYFKDLFGRVWEMVRGGRMSFYEAEKEVSATDHAQIGGYLAKRWQLPDSLVEAISRHHSVNGRPSNTNLILVVHAANTIVNNYGGPSARISSPSTIGGEAAEKMAFRLRTVSEWFPEVAEEIDAACDLFLDEV